MNDKELTIVAEKVADIVMDRFKEERAETAKVMAEIWWNTPIDLDKHQQVITGQTQRGGLRKALEELKEL